MKRNAMLAGMFAFASVVVLTAGCGTDCDNGHVVTRCRKVCGWECEGPPGYGCFFQCRDNCWDECFAEDTPPSYAGPSMDAGTSPPPASDAAPPDDGGLALCAPCLSNDQCAGGGLCIRPGADGGAAFCGRACPTNDNCPAGFACTAIGAHRQCVPTSGACP